jgi:hypothetical protein
MRFIASRLPLILTGLILVAVMGLLATGGPEYCGRPGPTGPSPAAAAADGPAPTLAPPQKIVLVRVEADKSDLEIGWAN